MPSKIKKPMRKSVKRRRSYKRSYAAGPRKSFSQKLIPSSKIVRMRYCERGHLTGGASGVITKYQYSGNGLYDPNITGTGHQPMYFDQTIPALYTTYEVIGFKAKLNVSSTVAGGNPICVAFRKSIKDETYSDIGTIIEKGCKSTVLTSNNAASRTLVLKGAPRKMLGYTSGLNLVGLTGSSGANPSYPIYLSIYIQDIEGNETVDGVDYVIDIEYIVKVSGPSDVGQS